MPSRDPVTLKFLYMKWPYSEGFHDYFKSIHCDLHWSWEWVRDLVRGRSRSFTEGYLGGSLADLRSTCWFVDEQLCGLQQPTRRLSEIETGILTELAAIGRISSVARSSFIIRDPGFADWESMEELLWTATERFANIAQWLEDVERHDLVRPFAELSMVDVLWPVDFSDLASLESLKSRTIDLRQDISGCEVEQLAHWTQLSPQQFEMTARRSMRLLEDAKKWRCVLAVNKIPLTSPYSARCRLP